MTVLAASMPLSGVSTYFNVALYRLDLVNRLVRTTIFAR